MRDLLRANFYRLRRSRSLLLCMAGAFVIAVCFLLKFSDGDDSSLDDLFLQTLPFLPIACAVFVSLFLGVEYQEGLLRNKLIAGRSRTCVYLTAFTAALTGCLAILAAWALSAGVGTIRFGWFRASAPELLMQACTIILLTAAVAAILTLAAMLIPNRAISAVIAILLALGLLVLGSVFYNALCEPELYTGAVLTANGFEIGDPTPNPNYISGSLRTVYQWIVDILPSGQAILLANHELERPVLSMCASACIVLLTGAAGMAIFERKDLK